jgi:SAM-dependent methyltransferase
MDKFFIDKEINVYRADQADRLLKDKNDIKYYDEKFQGIHKVDLDRWKDAQYYEKKTWMKDNLFKSDDRNDEHLIRFNFYKELREHFIEKSLNNFNFIELGCGPFTNTKLFLDKFQSFNFEKVSLLDPLAADYLNHPNCFYKNKKINGKEVDLYSVAIEQFETEEKYDVLLITNVLEHCYDIDIIFDKIFNLLKKDGILIFSDVFFKGSSAKYLAEKTYDAGHPLKLSETKMKFFLKKFEPIFSKNFERLYGQSWRNDKYFIGFKK